MSCVAWPGESLAGATRSHLGVSVWPPVVVDYIENLLHLKRGLDIEMDEAITRGAAAALFPLSARATREGVGINAQWREPRRHPSSGFYRCRERGETATQVGAG
jgi:hypothetical protein